MSFWKRNKQAVSAADSGRVQKAKKTIKRSPPVAMEVKILAVEALDSGLSAIEVGELGLFGVPSFLLGAELFWGHDRMGHLADRIRGRLASTEAGARRRRGDRL